MTSVLLSTYPHFTLHTTPRIMKPAPSLSLLASLLALAATVTAVEYTVTSCADLADVDDTDATGMSYATSFIYRPSFSCAQASACQAFGSSREDRSSLLCLPPSHLPHLLYVDVDPLRRKTAILYALTPLCSMTLRPAVLTGTYSRSSFRYVLLRMR